MECENVLYSVIYKISINPKKIDILVYRYNLHSLYILSAKRQTFFEMSF